MIKLAANLSTTFREFALPHRFARAAAAGFTTAELQFPYDTPADTLAAAARTAHLSVALINAPAGDLAAGERGLAIAGGPRFEAAIARAIEYATRLACTRIHVLIGKHPGELAGETLARTAANLHAAATAMARTGITLLLEALNPHNEPGYALLSLHAADALRRAAASPNIQLQFDAYHAQRRGEDAVASLHHFLPHIAHVQIARAPDRAEPDDAATARFLAALDGTAYAGFVGCEYTPAGDTQAGLAWAALYGIRPARPAISG